MPSGLEALGEGIALAGTSWDEERRKKLQAERDWLASLASMANTRQQMEERGLDIEKKKYEAGRQSQAEKALNKIESDRVMAEALMDVNKQGAELGRPAINIPHDLAQTQLPRSQLLRERGVPPESPAGEKAFSSAEKAEERELQRGWYRGKEEIDTEQMAIQKLMDALNKGGTIRDVTTGATVKPSAGEIVKNWRNYSVIDIPRPTSGGFGLNLPESPEDLTDTDKRIAADLAFGRLPPHRFNSMYSKRRGADQIMRQVYNYASILNPQFDAAQYEADFNSFKTNAQRNQWASLRRAEKLLDTYTELSDSVRRGDVLAFNAVANEFGLQLSDINTTNLKTLQTVMTEDLGRALTQSGVTSDMKMRLAGDISDIMNVSNRAAREKIGIIREIIDANKSAIRELWGVYGRNREENPPPGTEESPGAGTTGDAQEILDLIRRRKAAQGRD